MKKSTHKFENLLYLLNILSRDRTWKNAGSLANELGVSARTVMRYLNDLDFAFGLPIIERSHEGFRLKSMDYVETLTHKEDFGSLAAIKSTPLGALLGNKVKFPGPALERIQEIIEIKGSIPDDILKRLFKALRFGNYIKLKYQSEKEVKTHTCIPLKIYLDFSLIYVIVFDKGYGFMITLGASKIKSIELTRETMNEREMENLRDYINSAWGKMIRHNDRGIIEAKFSVGDSLIAYFKQNPLHSSQKIDKAGDRYIISMKIHSPVEFVRWSLRFGPQMTILNPPEVIDELKHYLDEMSEKYKS